MGGGRWEGEQCFWGIQVGEWSMMIGSMFPPLLCCPDSEKLEMAIVRGDTR